MERYGASMYAGEWVTVSKQMRASLHMSPTYRPWTSRKALRGVPTSPRMRESIDISWIAAGQKLPLYLDISQCVSRKSWSSRLACMKRSSLYYDYSRDEVIPLQTMLLFQGVPLQDLRLGFSMGVDGTCCSDLAGEAMFLPSIGTILLACFLNEAASWWNQPADATAP